MGKNRKTIIKKEKKKILKEKTLIIDCNNFCHAAFYAMGDLSIGKELKTGIIFGFMKRLLYLAERFKTAKFIFCWDSYKYHRKVIYPGYKWKDEKSKEEKNRDKVLCSQIILLRDEILPTLGFRNVFYILYYEADDIMAKAAKIIDNEGGQAIICTTDNDLLQCLNYSNIYNPRTKKIISKKDFEEEWDINPRKWVRVKAMAGCIGDRVEGIVGVGEKTAVKYITGKLNKGKIFKKIQSEESEKIIKRNRKLVRLPYRHSDILPIRIEIGEDRLKGTQFEAVFDRYGFVSLLTKGQRVRWMRAFNFV